jgi:LysM repeat protein
MQNPVVVNRSETIQVVDGKEYYFHAVLQGQTLYSIARAYGVSQDDIIKENPELRYGLKSNQLIKIPVVKTTANAVAPPKKKVDFIEHTVKRRETLYGIARHYEVPQELILDHNPDARRGLQVNMILKIPVIKEEELKEENFTFYIANPGDTPYGISRMYNLPLDTLAKYNSGILEGISVGQRIAIPRYKYIQKVQNDVKIVGDSIFEFESQKENLTNLYDIEYCNNPILKNHYNVALMIPLYTEQISEQDLTNGRIPLNHPSFEFIQFYEGIMIAFDSVKKAGVNITLHVFDVCQDKAKVLKAVNSKDFNKMDLIIGPFFAEPIKSVVYYAERNNIAMVSPLYSNLDQLNFSKNLIQITPSLQYQLSYLADYVSLTFPEHNIVVVHSDQQQVMPTINKFTRQLNASINRRQFIIDSINLAKVDPYFHSNTYVGEKTTKFYLFNDSLVSAHDSAANREDSVLGNYLNRQIIREFSIVRDTIGALILELDSTKKNLVVALVSGEVHVSNVLRQLHNYKDTFDITVVGIPQWRNLESVDLDYMNSLKVHLFATDYIDYSETNIQDFVKVFRDTYYTEPQRDAFLGVEIGYYFFNALNLYGKDFHKCFGLINSGFIINNAYNFQKALGENGGWENQKSTILRYKNYRIVDIRKPSSEASTSDH